MKLTTKQITGHIVGILGVVFVLFIGYWFATPGSLGATPSSNGLPGIYNATPTDLGLRDGYGSALLVDASGRLVISPSSTVSATSLSMSDGFSNAVLFLDENKTASSSPNFIFDGTTPSTGAGSMAIGVGATTSSNALLTIDGNNGTNIYGLRLLDQGAGTSGFRYDLSANGDLHIDTSGNIYSGTDFRIGTTNRPLRIQVNSSAFNSGSPYGMDFDVLALPTKVSFQFNGSDGQVADLFNIYNNSASSSPVFAINAQGKTAIGSGASTSTSARLSVSGITSSTQFSAGAGSVSSPAINFSGAGETNTGLFVDAGGRMAVAVDGALEATWYSTHFEVNDDILPASSNALDLGSTVRLFRDGWFGGTVTSTNIQIQTAITPFVNEGATLGTSALRFGALYLDTPGAVNAVNIVTGSPYEIMFTGASGADIQSSQSNLKIGTPSTFSTQLYSGGGESTPQLILSSDGGAIDFLPGNTTTKSVIVNATSTQIIGGLGTPTSTLMVGNATNNSCDVKYHSGTAYYITYPGGVQTISTTPCN